LLTTHDFIFLIRIVCRKGKHLTLDDASGVDDVKLTVARIFVVVST